MNIICLNTSTNGNKGWLIINLRMWSLAEKKSQISSIVHGKKNREFRQLLMGKKNHKFSQSLIKKKNSKFRQLPMGKSLEFHQLFTNKLRILPFGHRKKITNFIIIVPQEKKIVNLLISCWKTIMNFVNLPQKLTSNFLNLSQKLQHC